MTSTTESACVNEITLTVKAFADVKPAPADCIFGRAGIYRRINANYLERMNTCRLSCREGITHLESDMAEEKKTLLDAVQPLIFSFNLLYGFNLGNRKPPGCAKRLRKQLHKFFVWLVFLYSINAYRSDRFVDENEVFTCRWVLIINIFSCAFYLFAFNEPEMERLVRRLKRYKMGRMSERATSRMIKVFLIALLPLLLPILDNLVNWLLALYFVHTATEHELTTDHVTAEEFPKMAAFICALFNFYHVTLFMLSAFPILLSCLCCVLVSYCPSRLDDHVEDILRAHSPLRRATLLTRLCHAYYKVQPLSSMTNRDMATTMSLMKIFTMLLWVIGLNFLQSDIQSLMYYPVLQYSIPLLMYLGMAPSANLMRLKIFKAAAEVLMVDDERQRSDPLSLSPLTKLRLNLLQHLVHIRMDEGPFTLLGDSVDPETLFMIFVEANDMRSVLA